RRGRAPALAFGQRRAARAVARMKRKNIGRRAHQPFVEERRDLLHEEISRTPSPGLVAHIDGEAAGWVRIGPRTRQARIARTKNIAANTNHPLDDDSVWAITCFSIPKEHRGKGVTAALLDAAIDHARASGARTIEAYPTDTGGTKRPANDLYLGTLTTYLGAGFTVTGHRKPGHPIVTLAL
ncbi:MAG TPA: GNAT family N-acetyltransferase, partial [Terrimesophilobacter sp.]|nr:GNAT family N-acetyltransferase [Terrimesophilobacter sp.]